MQPPTDKFTYWHLLIGVLALLVQQDVENAPRMMDVKNGYLDILIQSSPSALAGMISGAVLAVPNVHLIASNPVISNLSFLTHYFGLNTFGSGFGIVSGTVFLGLGFSWKITGVANFVAFLLAPLFSMAFVSYAPIVFSGLLFRVVWITTLQTLLYMGNRLKPRLFEDALAGIISRIPEENLRKCPCSTLIYIFNLQDVFFTAMTLRRIRSAELRRRSSVFFTTFLHRSEQPLETIGDVVQSLLGSESKVENCEVGTIVTLTNEAEQIVAKGSPIHRLLDLFAKNCFYDRDFGKVMIRDDLERKIRSTIGTDVLEKCIKEEFMQVRKRHSIRYIKTGAKSPGKDNVQDLLKRVQGGNGKAKFNELQKHGAMHLVDVQMIIEGNFKQKDENGPSPRFVLTVKR
ncbi:hypothetical protein CRE_02985 [Caenorhabditis remanei]|uniref:Uncharacterized protein n=1 Tax=Caenorhabditis remanei TaxID=31234 RepID=E3LX22_CAERE|nr:hypothetical protein CRE_02985 [Caenorhabditis remanei]